MSRHLLHSFSQSLSIFALTLMFILTGVVGLARYQTAHAASAKIVLTPTSAHYSQLYASIFVQGSHYAAHESVKVYWNYNGPGKGTLETTATTDSTGAFLAQFITPLAATGTYTVAGVGQTSKLVATAPFLLLPHLGLNPNSSGPSTRLTLTGNAFGAGETVKIYWNYTGPGTGQLLATAVGDSTGSFTTTGQVPANAVPGSTTPVAGIGQTTKAITISNYITYPPTLTLAPLSGSPATSLTLGAYGFKGLEKVNIFWNNGSTPIATGQTDSSGYIVATITVPSGATPGSYPVKIVGQSTHITATNTFTVVAPASNLGTNSGPVGTKVKVTGQGYAPNEQVTIYWNYSGPGTGSNVATFTAGIGGTINVNFLVPASTQGSYTVAAVGATSNIVTTNTFTVANGLAASPTTRAPGTATTVAGSGYQASEAVNLYWDNTSSTPLATANADSQGDISVAVTFPANATPSNHSIIGVGQTSGHSFTAAVIAEAYWNDFGFAFLHTRENPYENGINTSNVASLNLKWSATTTKNFQSSAVYGNGIVYAATIDGFLNAYDATTGHLKWQFNSHTGFKNYSSPLLDPVNNLVFFGLVGRNGSGIPTPFYALDAQTGALKWSIIIPGNEFAFPTLGVQAVYLGVSIEGLPSVIDAIDEVSGHILWQYNTNGGAWGAIAIDSTTHALFSIVGNPSNVVVSLNTKTGALNWQHTLPIFGPDDDPGSGITIANGLVYVDDKNGSEYALNESTGNQVWSTQIGSDFLGGDVSTQAVSANGVLYVGSLDTNLYALNATTGAVLWKTPTVGGIDSSPAVANGVVYFASFDGKFYALDATSGSVLWSYSTGKPVFSSPIVVNGWLYCGSTNGKLYAFSL